MIFLHQSVGAELLRQGNVRAQLRDQAPDLRLWDCGFPPPSLSAQVRGMLRSPRLMPAYYYGLRNGDGQTSRLAFDVPATAPEGLGSLFMQEITDPPSNTLSHLLQFDMVAFKSCFTIFPLASDEQLRLYQQLYANLYWVAKAHPNVTFLPLTPPPLRASLCDRQQAERARRFARWMRSEQFCTGCANVQVFDLLDELAVPEGQPEANTLRPEFCLPDWRDSHPNSAGYVSAANAWVRFLVGVDRAARLKSVSRSVG